MLQSSGALSVYPKSICLSARIGLLGTHKGDFYNSFYLILLKFKINHCTWGTWDMGADYHLPPPRGKAYLNTNKAHQTRPIALSPTHRRAAKRATPSHNPLQRHPPRFPSCQNAATRSNAPWNNLIQIGSESYKIVQTRSLSCQILQRLITMEPNINFSCQLCNASDGHILSQVPQFAAPFRMYYFRFD